jgi:DNA-binding transcriptional LysR family regulator
MKQALTFRQVEVFQAIMHFGNVTRAAEYLQVSQPAVSRTVADLQETAGFTLFRRTRTGMQPTAEAEALMNEVRGLFVGIETLNERMRAIRDHQVGTLRLATISLYGNTILPQLVAEFSGHHKGLRVSLDILSHEGVVSKLEQGGADIGVIALPAFSNRLEKITLASKPALCLMPKDHRLVEKPVITAEDLEGEAFIGFIAGTTTRFQIDAVFERAGVTRNTRYEVGSHEAAGELVRLGAGIAILSPFTPYAKHPDVVARPFHPAISREVAVLLDNGPRSRLTESFVKFMTEYFKNDPQI